MDDSDHGSGPDGELPDIDGDLPMPILHKMSYKPDEEVIGVKGDEKEGDNSPPGTGDHSCNAETAATAKEMVTVDVSGDTIEFSIDSVSQPQSEDSIGEAPEKKSEGSIGEAVVLSSDSSQAANVQVPSVDSETVDYTIPKSKGIKRKLPTSTHTALKAPVQPTNSPSIVSSNESAEKTILKKSRSLVGGGADVLLVSGNKKVPTFKRVLLEASSEFEHLFESSTGKSSSKMQTVKIDFQNPDSLSLFVKNLTDPKDLSLKDAMDLITVATKYKVDGLVSECLGAFFKHINKENILNIKFLAMDSKNEDLNKHVDDRMPCFLKDVIKSNDFLQLPIDKLGKLIARENLQMSPENVQKLADGWLAYEKRGRDPSLFTQVQARVLLRIDENWNLSMLDEKPEGSVLPSTDSSQIPGWIFLQSLVTPKKCVEVISEVRVLPGPSPLKNKFGEPIKAKYVESDDSLLKPTSLEAVGVKRKRIKSEVYESNDMSQSPCKIPALIASLPRIPKLSNRSVTPIPQWGETKEVCSKEPENDSWSCNSPLKSDNGSDGRYGNKGSSNVDFRSQGRGGGRSFGGGGGVKDNSSWGGKSANINQEAEDDWDSPANGNSSNQAAASRMNAPVETKNEDDDDDWGCGSQKSGGGSQFGDSQNNNTSWNNNRGGRGRGRGGGDGGTFSSNNNGGSRGRGRGSFDRPNNDSWSSWGNENNSSKPKDDDWGLGDSSNCSNSGGGRRDSYGGSNNGGGERGGRGGGRGRGGYGGRGGSTDFANREDNWSCPESSCGFSNFATRWSCFKCHVPKPGGDGGNNRGGNRGGRGFRGGGGGGRGSFQNRGNNSYGAPSQTATSNIADADEDWDNPTPTPAPSKTQHNAEMDDWDAPNPTPTPAPAPSKTQNNAEIDDWDADAPTQIPSVMNSKAKDEWGDKPSAPNFSASVVANNPGVKKDCDDDDGWGDDSVSTAAPNKPVGSTICRNESQPQPSKNQTEDACGSGPVTISDIPAVTNVIPTNKYSSELAAEDIVPATDNVKDGELTESAIAETEPATNRVGLANDSVQEDVVCTNGAPPNSDSDAVASPVTFVDPRIASKSLKKVTATADVGKVKSPKMTQGDDAFSNYRPILIEATSLPPINRGWNSKAALLSNIPSHQVDNANIQQYEQTERGTSPSALAVLPPSTTPIMAGGEPPKSIPPPVVTAALELKEGKGVSDDDDDWS